jgi:phosphoribosylformylglycinamidine cyclo-ligase
MTTHDDGAEGTDAVAASPGAYAAAGVDIEAADHAKQLMRDAARSTHGPEVLAGLGGFSGLYALAGHALRDPVLVASMDGVGTKLKVAFALGRHESVGADLVAHCVNDILVCGARPLFFLDYLGLGTMDAAQAAAVVAGVAAGCRAAGCALIGGETAAMPGFYAPDEYDLAGCIVGVVERAGLITGESIRAGDTAIGLPSAGLHTNGYALARRALPDVDLRAYIPVLGRTLGDELLQPHRCYLDAVAPLLDDGLVTGMAHITGGGLVDNLPRVVPDGLVVRLDATTWDMPPIFRLIQERGGVTWAEMVRVFNLGLGYVVFCRSADAAAVLERTQTHGARRVGHVAQRVDGAPVVVVEGLA